MNTNTSIGHMPAVGSRWSFDEGVTECFDDMLARSIPQHDEMRAIVTDLAKRFATNDTSVVDLGCSRGEALDRARGAITHNANWMSYVGCEVSPPMLAAARERFAGCDNVKIVEHDLRLGMPSMPRPPSVIMSVLTLQFTPIEYRQQIIRAAFDALALVRNGAFILVEKVIGSAAKVDRVLVDAYLDRKRASGYSDAEIERKRHALEGVLVPVTARWNEDLLRGAGFAEVECVWRTLNFAGWLAIA